MARAAAWRMTRSRAGRSRGPCTGGQGRDALEEARLVAAQAVDQDHVLDPVAGGQGRDARLAGPDLVDAEQRRAAVGSLKKPSKATARSRLPRAQSRRERKASRPESRPSRSSSQVAASVPITTSGSLFGETVTSHHGLVELDRPAQSEVVELDPIAGAEAGSAPGSARGGRRGGLHSSQSLLLERCLSQAASAYRPERLFPLPRGPSDLLADMRVSRRQ